MRYTIAMGVSLAVFWLINSGHYSALILSFGAASVALVMWISHRMDIVDHESQPLHLVFRIPRYWAWLAGQIVLSNIEVVKRVWGPGRAPDPVLARLPLPLQSDICRVVYANSINLTPGTLTVDMGEDYVLVHALNPASIEELKDGKMARRIARLEQ